MRDSIAAEADAVGPMRRSMTLSRLANAPCADEEDVRRVDGEELLVGMLAPALRRHARGRPLRIFSSACWTPSPDTSRVIDGLSALRAILSTSSM
jgi:hypothetical protein